MWIKVKIGAILRGVLFFCGANGIETQAQTPRAAEPLPIGIFGQAYSTRPFKGEWCDWRAPAIVTAPHDSAGNPTSQLEVLKEDGFSHVYNYQPATWNYAESYQRSLLTLLNYYGLKTLVHARDFYHPKGFNIYDDYYDASHLQADTNFSCKARPNFDALIRFVWRNAPAVWGMQVTEEASFFHDFNPLDRPVIFDGPENIQVEVPPANVDSAMRYFRETFAPAPAPRMVMMEALHHQTVHAGTTDPEGRYSPQHYLALKPDVYMEGSYVQFPEKIWFKQNYNVLKGFHYLGKFRSIDFARKFTSEVHSVVNIEPNGGGGNYAYHYHSNLAVPNGNWLWAQTFLSFIHGAKGIWFWDLEFAWGADEKPADFAQRPDRFTRKSFPQSYNRYVAPLARRLRYLADEGFLPQLNFAKTDSTEKRGLLPPVAAYLSDSALKKAPVKIPKRFRKKLHAKEAYGIRYGVFGQGKDKILILVNAAPVAVSVPIRLPALGTYKYAELLFENVTMDDINARHSSEDDGFMARNQPFRTILPENDLQRLVFRPLETRIIKLYDLVLSE